jgi:hypothetical protein
LRNLRTEATPIRTKSTTKTTTEKNSNINREPSEEEEIEKNAKPGTEMDTPETAVAQKRLTSKRGSRLPT